MFVDKTMGQELTYHFLFGVDKMGAEVRTQSLDSGLLQVPDTTK